MVSTTLTTVLRRRPSTVGTVVRVTLLPTKVSPHGDSPVIHRVSSAHGVVTHCVSKVSGTGRD